MADITGLIILGFAIYGAYKAGGAFADWEFRRWCTRRGWPQERIRQILREVDDAK